LSAARQQVVDRDVAHGDPISRITLGSRQEIKRSNRRSVKGTNAILKAP
jgi:hypothetical protein